MTIQSQRSSRSNSRTPPIISKPIPQDHILPVSFSPKIPTKSHRPSLSSSMSWLGRSSSSSSTSSAAPHALSKSIRISEPQLQSAYDLTSRRSGTLGTGATIVRTPQEALAGPRDSESDGERMQTPEPSILEEEETEEASPGSPPLPPLPLEDDEEDLPTPSRCSTPSRPTRAVPPTPVEPNSSPSIRPSLKVLDSFPPVPALPVNLPSSPPQPPFEPILLSAAPVNVVDPRKTIVSIETCTATYKTTLSTLTSRPSFLASYLEKMFRTSDSKSEEPDEDEESVYSRQSEAEGSFNSIFRNHLAASGLLSTTSTTIQLFLDRPSAPYAHILSYLRMSPATPEHPAVLPRAVQLTSSSSSRLDILLELRDEARYLDLDELYKLCTDELRTRHYLGMNRASHHSRGISSASMSSSSVRSLGTLRENDEGEEEKRLSEDSCTGSSTSATDPTTVPTDRRSPANSVVGEVGWHASPSSAGSRGMVPKKFSSMRIRPTGDWI